MIEARVRRLAVAAQRMIDEFEDPSEIEAPPHHLATGAATTWFCPSLTSVSRLPDTMQGWTRHLFMRWRSVCENSPPLVTGISSTPPRTLAMALIAEAGELTAEFQWLTEAQSQVPDADQLARIRAESADVLLYLVRLADKLDFDLLRRCQ